MENMKPTSTLAEYIQGAMDGKSIEYQRTNDFFANYNHKEVQERRIIEYKEKLAKIKEQKDKMWDQRKRFYYDHLVLKEAELKTKDPSIRIVPRYQ